MVLAQLVVADTKHRHDPTCEQPVRLQLIFAREAVTNGGMRCYHDVWMYAGAEASESLRLNRREGSV